MNNDMPARYVSQNLVIGGGIAGIVTALELLDAGQSVTLIDRDTPERFGGLARWAFGGMALVGTPEQKRLKIADSPGPGAGRLGAFRRVGGRRLLAARLGGVLRRRIPLRCLRLAQGTRAQIHAGRELGGAGFIDQG